MAVRSGAGTGVIVSLVVFVLTTVFGLVMTIVFYGRETKTQEQLSAKVAELSKYKPTTSDDRMKAIEGAATANGQPVATYLVAERDKLLRFVNGDPTVTPEQLEQEFVRFGTGPGDSVRDTLERQSRALRAADTEIDGLKERLSAREEELAERKAQLDKLKEDQAAELELVSSRVVTYREAGEEYGQRVQSTVEDMNRAKERLRADYEARIEGLEEELDEANQEVVLMRSRVDEYESIFDRIRMKATNPELLVDGTVLDVDLANDQVYIDRGRTDRIVLGMTFEVYDDASSIRVNERTSTLPRGKASLQVVKVGETSATCKITRAVPGRPVVRNNVIANAIYDPTYRFKFLVHGKFDVDGDGRPSEAEAEYLRSLVIDWGGEIVMGEDLPGDLDFLVLGEKPPYPAQLRNNATEAETRRWLEQRAAVLKYEELFERASEAQIPVLNANRFFILIGHTQR